MVGLGQGDFEGLFAADALVEGGRIELHATADLGDIKGDATHAGGEGLVLVSVGVAETGLGALVGLSAQGAGTFPDHGLVDLTGLKVEPGQVLVCWEASRFDLVPETPLFFPCLNHKLHIDTYVEA